MDPIVQREDRALLDKCNSKEDDVDQAKDVQGKTESRIHIVKGYITLTLSIVSYTISVTSSQGVGILVSVFLANTMRFIIETVLSAVFIAVKGLPLIPQKGDVYKLVIAALLNYGYITAFYMSSMMLPVGNMDGSHLGLMIVFAIIIDVIRKQVAKVLMLLAAITVVGLLFLTQPWQLSAKVNLSLCVLLDHTYLDVSANISQHNNVSAITISDDNPSSSTIAVGYILVGIASIASGSGDNISTVLYRKYSIFSVFLWVGIVQALLSIVIVTSIALVRPEDLSFPKGTVCFSLTVAFMLCMTAGHALYNVAFLYVPISQAAVFCSMRSVALYIIQRTLFKMLNPGNANIMEIIGLVCITISSISSPWMSKYFRVSDETV